MDGIFGFITLACGLYCFYASYLVKQTKQIKKSIFFTKDLENKRCKDKAGYIEESVRLMLVVGSATLVYGVCDLLNTYVLELGYWFLALLVLFLGVLIWAIITSKKMNAKYF